MFRMYFKRGLTGVVILAILLSLLPTAVSASPAFVPSAKPLTQKAIFFSADGMRPDLLDRFAG